MYKSILKITLDKNPKQMEQKKEERKYKYYKYI